jgi:hypothetical protein
MLYSVKAYVMTTRQIIVSFYLQILRDINNVNQIYQEVKKFIHERNSYFVSY